MSSVDTVNVRTAYNADGSLFSLSVEMQIKNDGWILAGDQMKAANDLADQAKNFEEEKIKTWLSELKAKQQYAQAGSPEPNKVELPAYDSAKQEWNHCDKHPNEVIWQESKSKPGVMYQYCPKCDEFLQKNGSRKARGGKG